MRRLSLLSYVALLACLGLVPGAAAAQETINQASISGRVVDQQGAVVPGARVAARQTETNITLERTTDGDGRFRFPILKLGPYELTVSLQGFTDAKRALTLNVGSAFEVPIALAVAGVDTSVSVVGQVPVIETARSQIAGTVDQQEVQTLALNGRNFLDIALLVPGVSPTNTASTQLFAETSAVPGQGISIGSQRNLSNNFIVDGLSANDDAAGLSGIPYTVDAVGQFQVVTSGGQAELGRALGGYVNVVTRSGTNATHGSVYGYFRDDKFNGDNALLAAQAAAGTSTVTKLPMSQQQLGASAGGPLVKDHTFYFANLERKTLNQSGLTTIASSDVATINARLQAAGYPGQPVTTGIYANPVNNTNIFGKVDHQMNGRDQLSVRYAFYDVTSSNSRGAGGLSAPSASAGLDNVDQTASFSNTWTLSSRTVNETRVQFAYSNLKALSTDLVGPAVSISGIASFGTLSGSPQKRLNRMFEVVDSVSQQRGAHAFRAGVDFLYNTDAINFPRSNRGAYTFSSLASFLSGTYNNSGFTQTFGVDDIYQTNPNVGFYAQDEWKATSSLTLNFGLRYDLQMLQTIATDTNNVSPRLGFAWAPFASRATVIRGSAGVFFDRVPLRALANALLSAGNTADVTKLQQYNVSLSPSQAGAPIFPAILPTAVSTATLFNLSTMDPKLQSAYSRQASVEVERQFGTRTTVSTGYDYVRGLGLLMSINQNVPTCVAAGTNNGCRPISTYANNSQYSAAGSSNYHGLHVSLVQRTGTWASYRVSYTLSKSMNNVSEFFFSSPIDPTDLSKDWARSDDDQRHRLVVNATLSSPTRAASTLLEKLAFGFQLSGTLQAYSALPFNITSGVTTIQGTTGRPIVDGQFISRNAGVGDSFTNLNIRLARAFAIGGGARAEVAVEGFNIANTRNDLTRNANFGSGAYPTIPSATFNQITAVGDPRSLQLAVRVRF